MTKRQRIPDQRRGNPLKATLAASDTPTSASHPHVRRVPVQGRRRTFVRRLLKGVAILIVLSMLGVAVLLGLLWNEHRTAITLPTPTGPFPVGRMMYDWVDQTRTNPLAPGTGQKRELVAWIWYPATPTHLSKAVDYMPAAWRTALARYQGGFNSTFLARDPSLVHAHSISNAAVSPAKPAYPVVMLRSGILNAEC